MYKYSFFNEFYIAFYKLLHKIPNVVVVSVTIFPFVSK